MKTEQHIQDIAAALMDAQLEGFGGEMTLRQLAKAGKDYTFYIGFTRCVLHSDGWWKETIRYVAVAADCWFVGY